jgi:hypothetical protein
MTECEREKMRTGAQRTERSELGGANSPKAAGEVGEDLWGFGNPEGYERMRQGGEREGLMLRPFDRRSTKLRPKSQGSATGGEIIQGWNYYTL